MATVLPASNTPKVMLWVTMALIPGALAEIYYLGWGVLINIVLCMIFAVTSEAIILYLRHRNIVRTLSDNSALLTGVLIALAIPPLLPWWIAFIGVCFSIIIAKQLYGGLGSNIFNPAMVGYVLLLISFPVEMTGWLPSAALATVTPSFLDALYISLFSETANGQNIQSFRQIADGFTMATPLDETRTMLSLGQMSSEIMSSKNFLSSLNGWIWINIGFLLGGLFLVTARLVHWQIPLSIIISVILMSGCFYLYDSDLYLPPWIHLITGGIMLGVFFIATDPVTSATTPKGRILYGVLIGSIIVIIRTIGGYPDAIAFAVLLLNIAVPTIDHYTKPVVYGHDRSSTRVELP